LFVCDPKVDEQGQRLLYQIPLRVSHQLSTAAAMNFKKKKKRQVFFSPYRRSVLLVRLEVEEEENWYINDDEICNQYERVDARGGREVDKSVAASSAISKQQRPVHITVRPRSKCSFHVGRLEEKKETKKRK
jgi:hypothetical protein